MGMIMHDDVPYGEGTSYTQGTGIAINNNIIAVDADNTPTENSEKPVKSKGVHSALEANSAKSASLLKSTVGWTGKNLLNDDIHFYESGISVNKSGHTFTIETTTVATQYASLMFRPSNNTMYPAGQYKLSLDVSTIGDATARVAIRRSNNSIISAKILSVGANLLEIDTSEDFYISVFPRFEKTNAVTLVFSNPMLRDASITDDTYEPYHESVETMYEEEIHGVNLLKVTASTQTINGVTFTVNADKSVTVNGTATADANFFLNPSMSYTTKRSLVMTGCPDNSAVQARITLRINSNGTQYFLTSDKEVVVPAGLIENPRIIIANGITVNNLTFKPMLRKAEIEDSTYRPYNPQAIQNQINAQGVLGAKNLAPNIATTNTTNNLTFTINDNKTISTSGTPSANTFLTVSSMNYGLKLEVGKKYKISGCPSGGSANTYKMDFRYDNNGTTTVVTEDVGNGAEFIYTQDMENASQPCLFIIRVASGTVMTGKTFKPMLRLASDPDDTYVPYAMTNRELTEKANTYGMLLPSTTDLNNIIENGIYFADNVTTNAPTGISSNYYGLIVMSWGENNIRQLLIAKDVIYTRSKGGSPVVWSSWYKYTGTVVS